jgi:hypothetical protein
LVTDACRLKDFKFSFFFNEGVSSKPLKSSAPVTVGHGGKMIQYKSIDDIPDGLPDSPQLKNRNNSPLSRVLEDGDKYDEEDDDYEDNPMNQSSNYNQNDNYNESSSNYSIKQPLFPSEQGYNDNRYDNENSANKVRSTNYPPLQSNNTKQPLVYHITHVRTPPKPFLNRGEEDWDDEESDDDSIPSYNSKDNKKHESAPPKKLISHLKIPVNKNNVNVNRKSSPRKPPDLPHEYRDQKNSHGGRNEKEDKVLDMYTCIWICMYVHKYAYKYIYVYICMYMYIKREKIRN